MPAYVVVQLADRRRSTAMERLKKLAADHDGTVLPESGNASDPDPFVTISVPDMPHANTLAAAVRRIDGVESAYAKPGEELP